MPGPRPASAPQRDRPPEGAGLALVLSGASGLRGPFQLPGASLEADCSTMLPPITTVTFWIDAEPVLSAMAFTP